MSRSSWSERWRASAAGLCLSGLFTVGYWEESRRRPEEVLFLKYEDLCREPKEQVRKLASFMKPFFSTSTAGGDDDEVVVGGESVVA
ncbi:unnamed protein product [Linum tenue]|uniref:Sulfotransferase n=1 Tax=Linum tenue TaxID=586396 RepID=A0AAV0GZ74_9ROSI|nr:unnamed protein product [Linum tenue]